jgi:hypothetical protein
VDALKKEYNQFVSLGKDLFDNDGIEWYEVMDNDSSALYNHDQSRSIGLSQTNSFHGAIYFPNDAIIDSSAYSKLLLHHAIHHEDNQHKNKNTPSQIRHRMNTIVTHIERLDQIYAWDDTSNVAITGSEHSTNIDSNMQYSAVVTCYDTITHRAYHIYCRHVIVAIGGLSVPRGCCVEDLYGIIRPCYSYLTHVPMKHSMKCQLVNHTNNDYTDNTNRLNRSPNFFTWNFTHDWCYTDPHHIRVSGEDHYTARKDAQQTMRCQNLIRWTYQQYDTNSLLDDDVLTKDDSVPHQSGVYTETPDCAPVIGSIASDTNTTICYIVGCNAWGQTILSYAATLIPPILGFRPMTETEYDAMKVLSIQRFSYTIVTQVPNSSSSN